jgi:hypothetical protein
LEGIADLAAIPLHSASSFTLFILLFRKSEDGRVEDFQWAFLLAMLVDVAKSLNIKPPDIKGLIL